MAARALHQKARLHKNERFCTKSQRNMLEKKLIDLVKLPIHLCDGYALRTIAR